jgi:hypothetical protein
MSNDELEQLARKYQMGDYGRSFGPVVDRPAIIKQLRARDRALREANPVPSQTITVGTMIGSAIQQGSPGAHATASANTTELKEILEKLKASVPELHLSEHDAQEIKSDLATMEIQLDSVRPKSVIIKVESLTSVRGILEDGGEPRRGRCPASH